MVLAKFFFQSLYLLTCFVSAKDDSCSSGTCRPGDGEVFSSVTERYESFPYPPVQNVFANSDNPIVLQSPSHLFEINHYLYGGQRDFCVGTFRVLIAGGGTGIKTLQLAMQLKDMGAKAEIVHLDLSMPSIHLAQSRLEEYGFTQTSDETRSVFEFDHVIVTFFQANILDINSMDFEKFDYIDSLGVLHHVPFPIKALKILCSVLKDDGGMGIMLYGKVGRLGIYHAQQMLRWLNYGIETSEAAIQNAKHLVSEIPETNWLKADSHRWKQFQDAIHDDALLVDLLLPRVDEAFTVLELYEMIDQLDNMELKTFIQRWIYQPSSYLQNEKLLERLALLEQRQQEAFAELLAGNVDTHFFYMQKKGVVGLPNHTDMNIIPILIHFDPTALATWLAKTNNIFEWKFRGLQFKFELPLFAPKIIVEIDGQKNLRDIFEIVKAEEEIKISNFLNQWEKIYDILSGINKIVLTYPKNTPVKFKHFDDDRMDDVPHSPYHTGSHCDKKRMEYSYVR
eukprot:g322.t1